MNILVIGNGFDLAHGLPTKYGDFLEWIVDELYFYDYLYEQGAEIIKGVSRPNLFIPKSKFRAKRSSRSVKQHEVWECMDENFWLQYFLNNDLYQKENWIDFESEIKKIIQLLDFDMFDEKHELDDDINRSSSKFLKNVYVKRAIDLVAGSVNTYRQMRDKLRTDLNKLIRVLEIYLSDFVNSQECNKILPNIEEIMKYPFEYVDGSIEDKISYIISVC